MEDIKDEIDKAEIADENGFTIEPVFQDSDECSSGENEFEKPFKPKDIKIDVKPVPIERIITRIKKNQIFLSPDFQRNQVWDAKRKCRLIESLMLNIPLPIFYVSADENGNWSIVDGLQRLTAIKEFIVDQKYALSDLEFWKSLNGKKFEDLPALQYNQIMDATFQFVIISPSTPEIVRRNIFKRINTGGMPLSPQEIRHALYQGPGTDFLKKLSLSQSFKNATGNSVKDERMGAREIILRLLSFYLLGVEKYPSNSDMDSFLCIALKQLNQSSELENLEHQFNQAMNRSLCLFGSHSFRVSLGKNYHTPINKSLFETVGSLLMKFNDDDFNTIQKNKDILINKLKTLFQDQSIRNALSQNSWKITNIRLRFNKFEQVFNEALANDSNT